jgi:hypothetical protein
VSAWRHWEPLGELHREHQAPGGGPAEVHSIPQTQTWARRTVHHDWLVFVLAKTASVAVAFGTASVARLLSAAGEFPMIGAALTPAVAVVQRAGCCAAVLHGHNSHHVAGFPGCHNLHHVAAFPGGRNSDHFDTLVALFDCLLP